MENMLLLEKNKKRKKAPVQIQVPDQRRTCEKLQVQKSLSVGLLPKMYYSSVSSSIALTQSIAGISASSEFVTTSRTVSSPGKPA